MLIRYVDQQVATDFALLFAGQVGGLYEDNLAMTYAASEPGRVGMSCGTSRAVAHVRLELWDGRPPAPAPEWEDCDELPWLTLPGAGPVLVSGFDGPTDEPGLDLGGLGDGRVQVLASGRHRDEYIDPAPGPEVPPERWLLRWWSTPGLTTGMDGAPRRSAGPRRGEASRRTGWQAAVHALRQTGWYSELGGLRGFEEILTAVQHLGRPCSPQEIVAGLRVRDQGAGRHNWDSPVLGDGSSASLPPWDVQVSHPKLVRIAVAAGMPQIATFGDALTALLQLGLLAQCEAPQPGLLVPNPAPRPVWEVVELDDGQRHAAQTSGLYADFQAGQLDLLHLLRWAGPHGLTATPRQVALRLAVPVQEVLGWIRLTTYLDQAELLPDGDPIDADTLVTLLPRSALWTIDRRRQAD